MNKYAKPYQWLKTRPILSMMFGLSLLVCSASATTYYVDSVAGADTNNGTSTGTPWKTLTKVNSITFQPGDQVLFKRGCSWTGDLHILGTGSSTAPLVFDAYGTGAAPLIDGGGGPQAIEAWNKQYFTLQNFQITNTAATDGPRDGILLAYNGAGTFTGVKILNNEIHDVHGSTDRGNLYSNASIYVRVGDNTTTTRIDGMLIEGNYIHNNKNIGIYHKGPSYYKTQTQYRATNLVIRDNVFDQTGADYIVISGANAPVIESNAGFDMGIIGSGYGWSGGMWSAYYCNDAVYQFNEVARVHNEKAPNDGDGQAFDCDLGADGTTIFQYNYTHDNAGGVLIMMSDDVAKMVIYRYNLSVNDDRQTNSGTQFPVKPILGTNSAHIYNNVFYTNLATGYKFFDAAAAYYSNNIFYAPAAVYPSLPTFSNNCYFGHNADVTDPYKVTADPQFVGPLPTGAGGDGFGALTTDIFKLQSTSPCINAGKSITTPISNGGEDFWGNPLYAGGYADIGAHEVPGGSGTPAAVTLIDAVASASVAYTGSGWTHTTDPLFYNSTRSDSTTVGNSVQCSFSGTNLNIIGRRGPGLGRMNVSIDGGAPVLVDCYWPLDIWRGELFLATGLSNTAHTATITVTTKNPASSYTRIALDYFLQLPVTPSEKPVVTTIDDQPATGVVAYGSGWTATTGDTSNPPKFYAGTRMLSSTVGSYVDFTFTGNGARIVGTKHSDYGQLSVSVDGGPAALVDCNELGLSWVYATKLYEVTGLSSGTHTLRATVATKDATATGNNISIDFFQSLVGGSVPAEVILDDSDSTGVTITGAWTSSTYNTGYYGADYIHDGNTGKGSKSVRFTPNLPVSGNYEVFARWTAGTNRATNVPIDVVTANGTVPLQANEQVNGSQWVSLGTYPFNAGTGGSVLISNTGTNGYVIVDAVRFLKP